MSQPFCGKRRLRDHETADLFDLEPKSERPRPLSEQAARDYANALWEKDGETWDDVPERTERL